MNNLQAKVRRKGNLLMVVNQATGCGHLVCLASAGSPFDHLVDRIDASINISAHNWANPSH